MTADVNCSGCTCKWLLLDGLRIYFLISHGTSEGWLKGALSYRVGTSRVMTRGAILAVLGLVLTTSFLSSCNPVSNSSSQP